MPCLSNPDTRVSHRHLRQSGTGFQSYWLLLLCRRTVPSLCFHITLSVESAPVVSQCYVLLRDTMVRVYRTTVPRHEDGTPSAALHGTRVALGRWQQIQNNATGEGRKHHIFSFVFKDLMDLRVIIAKQDQP